jgi:TonB family protein
LTILEDPLERAQRLEKVRQEKVRRLEELRREYPPDHVFKASEVERKAMLISKPEPGFTEEARSAAITGSVRVRMVLKHDGTVEVLGALNELPHGLTQRAIEAAKQIRFIPAQRNGRNVSQETVVQYNFNVY